MSMSIPGYSCRSRCVSPTTGCPIKLPGECSYYSGSSISGPGITTGDTLNIVINKLVSYISGSGGTVTSVAASITSGAIAISGSPITTTGTLSFTYTGTTSQYIRGNGTLATFPSPTVVSAGNGLFLSGTTVILGGTLTQSTDVNNSGNTFLLHGTASNILRTVSGTFQSNIATSTISAALTANDTSTNLFSEVNSTAGISSLTAGNNTTFYNTLSVQPTFIRAEVKTNTIPLYLQLNSTGQLQASAYGAGTFSGTATYSLQVDSSGNIIEGPVSGGSTADGEYTPTLFNDANITASTTQILQYYKVGNRVTVFGYLTIQGAGGFVQAQLGISLPVASNLASKGQCSGTGANEFHDASLDGIYTIRADAVNNRAQLIFNSMSGNSNDVFINFSYKII